MASPSFARNAIVLGLITAVGPFAIDMYLPALPTISADLAASTAATQMSLMAFFLAFGVTQVIYGPISDMVGRRAPLFFGLGLFVLGSIGCAMAPTIEWLIAFRFIQGLGACAGMVIPMAVVRDLHTGVAATRLMSLIMLVFSVSPILAPLAGSAVIAFAEWHAIFYVMAAAAGVALLLVAFLLPETRPPADRIRSGLGPVFAGYWKLLRDRNFLGLTFIGGLGMAAFFGFLASSSFVYIDHYGLTPSQYSLAFSINAVGFIGSAQFAALIGRKIGLGRMVIVAVSAFALISVVLLALMLSGVDSLAVLMALLFVGFAWLGLVIPSTAVLAMDAHGPIAGMASAMLGTLRFIVGGIVMGLVSVFFDGTAIPMVAAIAICAVAALGVTLLTLGWRERAHAEEPPPAPAE